jgi:hypothetical protein
MPVGVASPMAPIGHLFVLRLGSGGSQKLKTAQILFILVASINAEAHSDR